MTPVSNTSCDEDPSLEKYLGCFGLTYDVFVDQQTDYNFSILKTIILLAIQDFKLQRFDSETLSYIADQFTPWLIFRKKNPHKLAHDELERVIMACQELDWYKEQEKINHLVATTVDMYLETINNYYARNKHLLANIKIPVNT